MQQSIDENPIKLIRDEDVIQRKIRKAGLAKAISRVGFPEDKDYGLRSRRGLKRKLSQSSPFISRSPESNGTGSTIKEMLEPTPRRIASKRQVYEARNTLHQIEEEKSGSMVIGSGTARLGNNLMPLSQASVQNSRDIQSADAGQVKSLVRGNKSSPTNSTKKLSFGISNEVSEFSPANSFKEDHKGQ